VILGGMGNFVGALAGGLILGLAEGLSQLFLSSKVGDGVAYVLLVLILLLRPQGLFGGPGE
jgi:branched-chain amino acid transport system permease protein